MADLMLPRIFVSLVVAVIALVVIVSIGRLRMSLSDAASSGVEARALEALRDDLAEKLDACESLRDYAALSLRLMDTLKRLSEIQSGEPVERNSKLDELSKRRAARMSRASG